MYLFMGVMELITDKQVRHSFRKITDFPDVVEGFKRHHSKSHRDHHIDGRVNIQVFRGQPGRFWEDAPKAGCERCKALFFDFDVIPKYCFGCYKVVVELRTVLELFKLQLVFDAINLPRDNTRKCMVDNRESSTIRYKGYVYCRGLEEAQVVRDIIMKEVSDDVSTKAAVKVKRGCTEFPQKYPEYGNLELDKEAFKYRDEWKSYEDYVDEIYIFTGDVDYYDADGKKINPVREILAFQFWLRYAATIGDDSYLVVTGGKVMETMNKK